MKEAAPLTGDGDPELVLIEETNANTIEWKGHYRIEGDAFIYMDRGGTRAILGYPRRSWSKLRAAAEISNILARFRQARTFFHLH
jgi:hypothetical protein